MHPTVSQAQVPLRRGSLRYSANRHSGREISNAGPEMCTPLFLRHKSKPAGREKPIRVAPIRVVTKYPILSFLSKIRGPKTHPKSPNTKTTLRLRELFRKVRANFCLLPCDASQQPDGDCSEKLVQMNFSILGGFCRVDFPPLKNAIFSAILAIFRHIRHSHRDLALRIFMPSLPDSQLTIWRWI